MKRFDIAEMVVHVSREVWRNSIHRPLTISFDYRGCSPVITGKHERAFHGLRRLLGGAARMIDTGCLEFDGETRTTSSGAIELRVKAVGCGSLASESTVREVLCQLLVEPPSFCADDPNSAPRLRRASGRCPIAGMEVEFGMIPSTGFMLSSKWRWPAADVVGFGTTGAAPPGMRAWVVDENEATGATMVRRLRRAEWSAVLFSSCPDAERQWRSIAVQENRPSVVLLMEPRGRALHGRETLLARLSAPTRCISIVEPGAEPPAPAPELRIQPLSPGDLEQLAGA